MHTDTWIDGKDLMKHHCQQVFYRELCLDITDENCELYLEDITDKDYRHAQKLFEEFNLKNLDDSHDLYVQSDTLLLSDVFGNFRKKCIEVYELDTAHFLSVPGLAWQACLQE